MNAVAPTLPLKALVNSERVLKFKLLPKHKVRYNLYLLKKKITVDSQRYKGNVCLTTTSTTFFPHTRPLSY